MTRKSVFRWILVCGFCVLAPAMAAGGGDGHHGFDWGKFIAHIVNFIVFFGGLYYLLAKPVGNFFSDRLKHIKESLALAERSREEATQRLDEIDQKMSRLESEIAEIEAQAKAEAEREKQRIEEAARQEAERIVEQAKTEVANLQRQAMADVKAHVANLALEDAEKVIRKTITAEEQSQLFAGFAGRLGAKS